MYRSVVSGAPSRIIRCTTIKDLKTIVHVESRNRSWSTRKTSATPDSPPCVEERIDSMYFDFGAANYRNKSDMDHEVLGCVTLILVAPFTTFSILRPLRMRCLERGSLVF
jgi:hypothetical protein